MKKSRVGQPPYTVSTCRSATRARRGRPSRPCTAASRSHSETYPTKPRVLGTSRPLCDSPAFPDRWPIYRARHFTRRPVSSNRLAPHSRKCSRAGAVRSALSTDLNFFTYDEGVALRRARRARPDQEHHSHAVPLPRQYAVDERRASRLTTLRARDAPASGARHQYPTPCSRAVADRRPVSHRCSGGQALFHPAQCPASARAAARPSP
jgi:hypothetical protein